MKKYGNATSGSEEVGHDFFLSPNNVPSNRPYVCAT